ncbi:MAG: ABC transporter ATP-binding protein [Phycisphaerales bacterium]|nr:ABC transporter ATP-binding protein [Phycisphaerales bacterium]
MTFVVETQDLRKDYRGRPALAGIALRVPRGSLFGFLGPNGAGKTTAIRILMGLLRPTAGSASILGMDCWRNGPRLRREVGYLPGDVRHYASMTGRQTLRFMDRAFGGGHMRRAERLAERLELELDKRLRAFSTGMRQKLGLIQALMHEPQVLILDEPTAALDPLVRQTVFDLLRDAAQKGRTVLFSSHTLSEVDALCDHVAIVRGGKLIEQERLATLRQRAPLRVEAWLDGAASSNGAVPTGLAVRERRADRIVGHWSGPREELLIWLQAQRVADFTVVPDFESLFMSYYSADEVREICDPIGGDAS